MLEQVKNQANNYELIQILLTEFRLLVDSAKQPRERAEDNQEQKKYFFGKTKQHTLKDQLVTLPKAPILSMSS
jgi:hypothetical protein